MKKFFILIFTLISFNSLAVDKSTTFDSETFKKAQLEGKTVVINSWNETCTTCKKQIKILIENTNMPKQNCKIDKNQQPMLRTLVCTHTLKIEQKCLQNIF